MRDYILTGVIVILSILFAVYDLWVRKFIKASDECIKAGRDYIETLEKENERLRHDVLALKSCERR